MNPVRQALGSFISPVYSRLFPNWMELLKKELKGVGPVLDLGCGPNSPIQYCDVHSTVGVEVFKPYLEEAKRRGLHNIYVESELMDFFEGRFGETFQAAMAIQVLEHLEKSKALSVLTNISLVVTQKVIIAVPNGWMPQDDIDGNPYNVHKSFWSTKELRDLGFKVRGTQGLKILRGYRGWWRKPKWIPDFIMATISGMTQWIVYFIPQWSFQLFAVSKKK